MEGKLDYRTRKSPDHRDDEHEEIGSEAMRIHNYNGTMELNVTCCY